MKEVFPEVLGHEAEKSQESPTEGVVTGVAIVWVPPDLETDEALRTDTERTTNNNNNFSNTIAHLRNASTGVIRPYPASELLPHNNGSGCPGR